MGKGTENWHFSFLAAQDGKAWSVLGRHCSISYRCACWASPLVVRYSVRSGIVHSLTGQQDSMQRARDGAGLKL